MELKNISETIQQIPIGVRIQWKKYSDLDVVINLIIDMDIFAVVTATMGNIMGDKISISMMSIDGKTKKIVNISNPNRAKFIIPVCLPVSKV